MHLNQTFASMAHAAEAYPDPWGLPSMHLEQRTAKALRMSLGLTQIPGAYQHAFNLMI